jgi:hypothetical protein
MRASCAASISSKQPKPQRETTAPGCSSPAPSTRRRVHSAQLIGAPDSAAASASALALAASVAAATLVSASVPRSSCREVGCTTGPTRLTHPACRQLRWQLLAVYKRGHREWVSFTSVAAPPAARGGDETEVRVLVGRCHHHQRAPA